MNPKNIFLKSFFIILLLTFTLPAYAATYDIKEKTPAVEQALSGRQSRYSDLQALKAQGSIGETNQGYVKALSPTAQGLVDAENTDRQTLYNAIVQQNGLEASGLAQVEMVFAEVQREKARPGDSIQLASGEWAKK